MGHSHPSLWVLILLVGVALADPDPEMGLRSRGSIEEEVVVIKVDKNPHKKELECLQSITLEKESGYCSVIRDDEKKDL
jgi:hypothetical protein